MGAMDQSFFKYVHQHMKNVYQSLYCYDGTDENPIEEDDTIEQVVSKMADGVFRGGHPELLDYEVTSILWALTQGALSLAYDEDEDENRIYRWPGSEQMLKEIHVYGDKKMTEDKISNVLDIQPWDIKDRGNTIEGLRLFWVGVVLRPLAIVARQTESRNGKQNDE